MRRLLLLALLPLIAPGCLVVSVNPLYDSGSLTWVPELVGEWQDADDKSSMRIEAAEWRSYTIHYVHPSETGEVTGHVTIVDNARYLDVMPARGEDRGSFLVPVHAILRLELDGDRLELTPLSYDWMAARLTAAGAPPGLDVAFDQKENALIVSPTARLRGWLRKQPLDGMMFGAGATFTRVRRGPGRP